MSHVIMLLGLVLLWLSTLSFAGPTGLHSDVFSNNNLAARLVGFDKKDRANPIEVYQCTIKALCLLGIQGWSSRLPTPGIAVTIGSVVLAVESFGQATGRINHVIRALVELLNDMREATPSFFFAAVYVKIYGVPVATVGFVPTPRTIQNTALDPNDTSTASIQSLPFNQSDTLIQPAVDGAVASSWNVIKNPEILRERSQGFKVLWRYDGRSIPGLEMLGMFVDGFTTLAAHETEDVCYYLDAIGPSGGAVFHMHRFGGSLLHWYDVSGTMLALVVNGIIPSKRFAEMEFELWYYGTKFATGEILRINAVTPSSDVNRMASSR
ncbi:MAG: hypothetical protein Q9201_004555 [Fulgogasparrea decipioides]